jgi:hypothetical protein
VFDRLGVRDAYYMPTPSSVNSMALQDDFRRFEIEQMNAARQDFQAVNDQRVAAASYDRFSEIGSAWSAGRYGDMWRHITFDASDAAKAAALARSYEAPALAARRLDQMLSSPIGTIASLGVRAFGGNQTWQDAALLAGSFGENAIGGALGLPTTSAPAQARLASAPRGRSGDAYRAYLNQRFGRTGDLNFDINARGANSIRTEIDRLALEGHAVGRHGSRVTNLAIDNRAKFKWDPITGSTTDYYTRDIHNVGRNSSKFLTDEALLRGERFIRNSSEFNVAMMAAEAIGKPQFAVGGLSIEDALGPNYLSLLYGRSRVGSVGGLTVPIDFTDGTLTGVFRQSRNGWNLHTLYPEPKP